jgi:hypothetical protein
LRVGRAPLLGRWARAGLGHSEVAAQLGFAVFQDEAGLSAKLALGSSVGGTSNEDWLSIIVKSVKDIEDARTELTSVLQQAWQHYSG